MVPLAVALEGGRFLRHGSGAGLQSPPRRPTIQVQEKGNVRQIRVPVNLSEGLATMTMHQPSTHAVQEQVAFQAQVTVQRYEHVVAGQMIQQVVEVPIAQEVATAQEVPEVQVQVMEQVAHASKIMPQVHVQHRSDEQIVDVPVPMVQKQVVYVPKIIQQDCDQHQAVEQEVRDLGIFDFDLLDELEVTKTSVIELHEISGDTEANVGLAQYRLEETLAESLHLNETVEEALEAEFPRCRSVINRSLPMFMLITAPECKPCARNTLDIAGRWPP